MEPSIVAITTVVATRSLIGVQPSAKGNTPLHWACKYGLTRTAWILLQLAGVETIKANAVLVTVISGFSMLHAMMLVRCCSIGGPHASLPCSATSRDVQVVLHRGLLP